MTIAARVYQEREAGGRSPEDDPGGPGDPGGTDSQHSQRGRLRKSDTGRFFSRFYSIKFNLKNAI